MKLIRAKYSIYFLLSLMSLAAICLFTFNLVSGPTYRSATVYSFEGPDATYRVEVQISDGNVTVISGTNAEVDGETSVLELKRDSKNQLTDSCAVTFLSLIHI